LLPEIHHLLACLLHAKENPRSCNYYTAL
jgi:hypothetical protein